MREETKIGGGSGRFPATRWSAVVAARSENPEERRRAYETLIAAYWKPVYKYIRIRWSKSNEDAKDLTQEFFSRVLQKGYLDRFDPGKARLRTFLRVCVDGFVQNEAKAASRLKRGGDTVLLSLDFEGAEGELARIDPLASMVPGAGSRGVHPLEAFFEREWIRSLFGMVVDELRAECLTRGKQTHFRLFEIYDLEEGRADALASSKAQTPPNGTSAAAEKRVSYDQLARQFGIAVTDVTNYLSFARREFRRIALGKLREMTGSEEEFRREARSLLGVEVP